MDNKDLSKNSIRKRAKPLAIDSKELIELAYKAMKKNKKRADYPKFTKREIEMMAWLLFQKTDEFRVWMIKKCDQRAIREFLQRREATRQGLPYKVSSSYLRRTKFLKEFINSGFNAAEAARRCGYSWKYAKQIAYRIRKNLYSSPYW
jgi:hypothetical protein